MQTRLSKRNFFKLLGATGASLASGAFAKAPRQKSFTRVSDFRLCFGSCHHHDKPQTHWRQILKKRPDAWFWLGDNIYGDTRDLRILQDKYDKVLAGPYKDFRRRVPCYGIWDDHDFGEDGANRKFPYKWESQEIFLNFLQVPNSDERRYREGIYYSREFAEGEIKVYFLDCRYFKSENKGKEEDLLGPQQWLWLEEEMARSQARVNIFVTPIGFLLNRLFVTEDWAEYPDEKERLMKLIAKYDLSGAFFMSGDKHFGAMISRNWDRGNERVQYYELQSSGLTHKAPDGQLKLVEKFYGRKNTVIEKNFGQLDFHFERDWVFMTWTIHSLEGRRKLRRVFFLDKDKLWKRP